jgi:hypothetical protein
VSAESTTATTALDVLRCAQSKAQEAMASARRAKEKARRASASADHLVESLRATLEEIGNAMSILEHIADE